METEQYVLLQKTEYDIYTAPELEKELSVLESGDALVDFANVTYIDSTALGRLISTLKRMRSIDEHSAITVTNLSPTMRRLFEMTEMKRLFHID